MAEYQPGGVLSLLSRKSTVKEVPDDDAAAEETNVRKKLARLLEVKEDASPVNATLPDFRGVAANRISFYILLRCILEKMNLLNITALQLFGVAKSSSYSQTCKEFVPQTFWCLDNAHGCSDAESQRLCALLRLRISVAYAEPESLSVRIR